jgi:hypothetical protein
MERLRDQASSDDPTVARAASLLAAMPPLDPTNLRMRAPSLERAGRPPVRRLGLALAVALLLASLAAAGATTLRRVGFWARTGGVLGAPASVAPSSGVRSRPSRVTDTAPQPSSAGADPLQLAPAQVPAVPQELAGATPESSRPVAQNAGPSESTLIVDAVRALRREGDPARAQALAEEALRRYPRGAQVEEASALVFEAALALGDQVGARRAAQRYLTSFPRGRFADRARRALGNE